MFLFNFIISIHLIVTFILGSRLQSNNFFVFKSFKIIISLQQDSIYNFILFFSFRRTQIVHRGWKFTRNVPVVNQICSQKKHTEVNFKKMERLTEKPNRQCFFASKIVVDALYLFLTAKLLNVLTNLIS